MQQKFKWNEPEVYECEDIWNIEVVNLYHEEVISRHMHGGSIKTKGHSGPDPEITCDVLDFQVEIS